MPYRTFTDADGVNWEAWEVIPRGAVALPAGPRAGAGPESRAALPAERRVHVAPELRDGWLAFRPADGSGAHRRLAPIPPGWARGSEEELSRLCALATPTMARRGTR